MSLPEAIRLIQMHERARQGRERARIVLEIRQPATKAASRPVPTIDPNVAATRIQKVRIPSRWACKSLQVIFNNWLRADSVHFVGLARRYGQATRQRATRAGIPSPRNGIETWPLL